MKRIGEIAAMLVLACGWILAQEEATAPTKQDKAQPQAKPAPGRAAKPAAPDRKAASSPVKGATQEITAGTVDKPDAPAKTERPAGGWWDDVFTERTVALTKVLGSPDAFRDVPITFTIQFHQVSKTGPSFFTRFEPDSWLAFSAWSDDAALWEKKAYEADFAFLFVRRAGADFKLVNGAAIYDRFTVNGVVRDVIKGKPWIEVTSVRKLPEKMSEGSLVHLVKGLTLRDHRRFEAAARELEAADADTLPLSVRLLGMREQAFALLYARKPKAAEEKLVAALALDPDSSETAAALVHVREAMKDMPERLTASRPVPVVAPPPPEDDEPVTPGPPDPQADRPKKPMRLPFPKANPTDTRPANMGKQPKTQQPSGN